mmetsp:Transcript_56232/g.126743  ORF Transcript_56232/g.126743 Transcript_56232/m.126743 type:complete len:231 (-) Transcript_56232:54-746(-)
MLPSGLAHAPGEWAEGGLPRPVSGRLPAQGASGGLSLGLRCGSGLAALAALAVRRGLCLLACLGLRLALFGRLCLLGEVAVQLIVERLFAAVRLLWCSSVAVTPLLAILASSREVLVELTIKGIFVRFLHAPPEVRIQISIQAVLRHIPVLAILATALSSAIPVLAVAPVVIVARSLRLPIAGPRATSSVRVAPGAAPVLVLPRSTAAAFPGALVATAPRVPGHGTSEQD